MGGGSANGDESDAAFAATIVIFATHCHDDYVVRDGL